MSRYFAQQSTLATPDKVLSATTEAGLTVVAPVESSVSGSVKLAAEGTPSAAVAMNLKLQGGGNPLGYDASSRGLNSASLLKKDQADSTYQGFNPRIYLELASLPRQTGATGTDYMGQPSKLVELANGYGLFAVYHVVAASDTIDVFYTLGRSGGAWTRVVVFTDGDDSLSLANTHHRPAIVVRPDGRILCYFIVTDPFTGGRAITCYSSTDNGATWAQFQQIACTLRDASNDLLSAEYIGGEVVLVAGEVAAAKVDVYLSSDGGARFSALGDGNATYYRPATVNLGNGQFLIYADDNAAQVYAFIGAPGANADDPDGYQWVAIGPDPDSNAENRCIVRDDDGVLYLFVVTAHTDGYMQCYASSDDGTTWSNASPDNALRVFGVPSAAAAEVLEGLQGGWFAGQLVTLARCNASTGNDGTLVALWWGGWNQITERPIAENNGEPYASVYLPMLQLPDSQGWTRTDTGGGSTVGRATNGYLQQISSVGNYTYYSAPTAFFTDATHLTAGRWRLAFRVNSGGSTAADTILLLWVQASDGADAQWFKIRATGDNIAVYDNSGSIAATAFGLGAGPFGDWTELMVAFKKDGTSTTAGRLGLWYRLIGDTDWVEVANGLSVAEQAGVATSHLRFGGNNSAASNWDLLWLGGCRDTNGLDDWAGESALVGRPLSPVSMYVASKVYVRGYGSAGISGDTWTLDTGYLYGKEWILQGSASRQWRSTADNSTTRIVLDAGANDRWDGTFFALLGTNFKSVTFKFNTSDSWGAPGDSFTASAAIASAVTVSTFGKGFVDLTGTTYRPHQFMTRSGRKGRRYFLRLSGTGSTWEISDNTATRIYVQGVDLSAETGTATIFGDGMWVDDAPAAAYRYMAIEIAAEQTADNDYRIGLFVIDNSRIKLSADDGFEDGWTRRMVPNVEVLQAESGATLTRSRGPIRRTLSIRWSPKYVVAHPALLNVIEFYRSVNGPERPFVYIHDSANAYIDDSSGLYRFTSDHSLENVRDEDFMQVGQLVAKEEV